MTTRAELVAKVVRRRHAIAAERRRLLAFALHTHAASELADRPELDADFDADFDDDQVTLERPPLRFARGTYAPAFGGSDPSLAVRIDELRARTAAFRAQAIALDAKLTEREGERVGLHEIREQLAEHSARVEHAVDDIDAFSQLDAQLATLDR
jgi:hypothetical protein